MRRAIVALVLAALGIVVIGQPASSATGSAPDATFTLTCADAGVAVSGRVAGWYGMLLVEEDGQVVSVGIVSSMHQTTFRDGVWLGEGSFEKPGRHPGALSGCTGTMDWTYLGDAYHADLTEVEVTFQP